jgi:hypothetical protein
MEKVAFRSGGGVTLSARSWRFETDVFRRGDGEPLSDHDALAVRFAWGAQASATAPALDGGRPGALPSRRCSPARS